METINEKYAELLNENARLRRQVEAIKQAAIISWGISPTVCKVCKYSCVGFDTEPCVECDEFNTARNWQPPEVGE